MGGYVMKTWQLIVFRLIAFVISMALIIVGHQTVGKLGVAQMLVGLVGLLGLLWEYNRRYQS